MKGTTFNKPLEWNIEAQGESWPQGSLVNGTLTVKNHGTDSLPLTDVGVALAYADIKKIHARADGAMKFEVKKNFDTQELKSGESQTLSFSLPLPANCPVTDKKASFYLTYGRNFAENHLQLKVEPRALYQKIVGLLDTFHRFKLKEFKGTKNGVEYKLIPPTSREMANIESLNLSFSTEGENLHMVYDFQVRKLDTASVTTKVNKASCKLERTLTPKEYSLGKDMINQDQLLKSVESALSEVKMKNVF